ncbi:hypothetical protein NDU88_001274 [Pleurodeles waltl]|uniref:Uncharacterized protein n=1 Tax=Pleurodeles waltl TaxID=8319 RepID=A0AAV7TJ81_PLEWA|nr:hypothetical protein NDU88_001274 [Pleurodeles waltl]
MEYACSFCPNVKGGPRRDQRDPRPEVDPTLFPETVREWNRYDVLDAVTTGSNSSGLYVVPVVALQQRAGGRATTHVTDRF